MTYSQAKKVSGMYEVKNDPERFFLVDRWKIVTRWGGKISPDEEVVELKKK